MKRREGDYVNPYQNGLSELLKRSPENILKLHSRTPEPVVFFPAGYLRQLTLFGMICCLPENILHKIAANVLISPNQKSKNWCADIREIFFRYNFLTPSFF